MAKPPARITGTLLNERIVYTLGELGQASGLPSEELLTMVQVGVLEPLEGPTEASWRFTGRSVTRLQVALRLQRDLGVNPEGASLVLDLLDELRGLRQRADLLERQLFG